MSNNYFYNILSKFESILQSMANFAVQAKSSEEIDNTPNKLNLPGNVGDIITKDRHLLYYKSVNSKNFQSLSTQYPETAVKYEYVLSSGINRVATWTKSITGWKLLGYVTQNADENCCIDNRKYKPVIIWDNPSDISYNTPLSDEQLNATASYNGMFLSGYYIYNPVKGTVLPGGKHQLNVKYVPYDTELYENAEKSVFINVGRITQSLVQGEYNLSWNNPANISYGTPLSDEQLNAVATYNNEILEGIYNYTPPEGALLYPGTSSLNCTFIPKETDKFTNATASVNIGVDIGDLTKYVSWICNNTASIVCNGQFTTDLLCAKLINIDIAYSVEYSCSTQGITAGMNISDVSGFNLGTGHYLTASIIPYNQDLYNPIKAYCYIEVVGKQIKIEWNPQDNIQYKEIFSSTKYNNATVKYKEDNTEINGTYTYYYQSGSLQKQITFGSTICDIKPTDSYIYCKFKPDQTESCAVETSVTSSLTVLKNGDYTISWNPAQTNLVCGDILTSSILNAITTPTLTGYFKYYAPDNIKTYDTTSWFDAAGTYKIYPTFISTDGTAQNKRGEPKTFTVSKNPNYTISWNPTPNTLSYGDELPLNATVSPNINGIFEYKTGNTIINKNSAIPVGTNPITASFIPANGNYYASKNVIKDLYITSISTYSVDWNTVNYDFISFDKRTVNVDNWKSDVSTSVLGLTFTTEFKEGSTVLSGEETLSVGSHTITCTITPTNTGYSSKTITKTIVVSEFCFTNNNNELTITGYRDDITPTTISLNDTYNVNTNVYKVVAIDNNAFNTNLSSVTTFNVNETGHTIKSIGDLSFGGLINLTSLVNSSNSSNDVFEYMEHIGINPFINCVNLTPVKINNDKFITIDNVLYEKLSETEYKSICYYASATYNYYVLNSNIKQVGQYTFTNNNSDHNTSKLQVLVIPNDNNDVIVDSDAFINNTNLKTIYFPGNKNVELTNYILNGLSFENENTFLYFKQLTPNNFGSNLTTYYNLNNDNFKFVGNTTDYVYAPAKLVSNNYIQNLTASFSTLNSNYTSIKSVTVPYGYTCISGSALGNCSQLTSINIPTSIDKISEQYGLCYACSTLKNIVIYPDITNSKNACKYKVFNENSIQKRYNILFEEHIVNNALKYKLICYPPTKADSVYTIYDASPTGVNDFDIDEIGNYAFYNAKNLVDIKFGGANNLLLIRIGDQAFYGVNCTFDETNKCILPTNLSYLGKRAFEQNYAGTNEITVNDDLKDYGGTASRGFVEYSQFDMLSNPYAATDVIKDKYSVTCSTTPQAISIELDNSDTIDGYTGYNYTENDTCIYLYEGSSDTTLYDQSSTNNKKTLVSKFLVENAEDEIFTLSSSVNYIANYACYGMHNITEFDLTQGANPNLKYIGNFGLANCRKLERIDIPASLYRINDGAFSGNRNLKYVNLENCNLRTVGQWVFNHDTSIKSVTLNFTNSLDVSVSHTIFAGCTDMRVITLSGSFPIRSNVSNACGFSDDTFAGINNALQGYIYYPYSWESIRYTNPSAYISFRTSLGSASRFTAQTYREYNNIYYILNEDNLTAEVCGCKNTNGTISIDNALTYNDETYSIVKIRDYAFANKEMSSVSIPASVTEIGKYFVSGCENLSSFIVNASNTKFTTENSGKLLIGLGTPDDTSSRVLYSYAPNNVSTEFSASTVQIIRESAFDNCTNLEEIYISPSVNKIEPHAFYQCNKLSKIITDPLNQYYVSTNDTIEENTNTSDNGILYELPGGQTDQTSMTANLLYVPQNNVSRYLRIPSQLAITLDNNETVYYKLSIIKTGAIENTNVGVIIFPEIDTLTLESGCIAYNDNLNSVVFNSETITSVTDSLILSKNQYTLLNGRKTQLYSVNNTNNISGYTVNSITKVNYTITENNTDTYNANYYIADGTLIACTAEPNNDNNVYVYNNFTVDDTQYNYSSIDTYALSNRGNASTPMTIRFINIDNSFIDELNSDIFYGSYGTVNVYFNQDCLSDPNNNIFIKGNKNMFRRGNETSETVIYVFVPAEYNQNWSNFISGYGVTNVRIVSIT